MEFIRRYTKAEENYPGEISSQEMYFRTTFSVRLRVSLDRVYKRLAPGDRVINLNFVILIPRVVDSI